MTTSSEHDPSPVHEDDWPRLALRAGLALLDDWVLSNDDTTLAVVTGADSETGRAIGRHLGRRLRGQRRPVVLLTLETGGGAWFDLADRLGIPALSWDPREAARQIGRAASPAVVVVEGALRAGCWAHEVLECVAIERVSARVVLIGPESLRRINWPTQARQISLDPTDPEVLRTYWDGLFSDTRDRLRLTSLAELDRFAEGAGLLSPPEEERSPLGEDAQYLLGLLQAAKRSWPETALAQLSAAGGIGELTARRLVQREGGFVVVRECALAPPLGVDALGRLAGSLAEVFPRDAYAQVRACAAWLRVGQSKRALERLSTTLRRVPHVAARRDLWRIWTDAVVEVGPCVDRDVLLRAAEEALSLGDNDSGLDLVHALLRISPETSYEVLLLLARLQLESGDIVGAQAALERAGPMARDERERAGVQAYQAEAAYWVGDLAAAGELAAQVLGNGAAEAEFRLVARAVAGKLLLASGRWDEAAAHFSADESDAVVAGLSEAKLRARLNRAVVLVYKRRLEEARGILEQVLDDGTRLGSPRAVAKALLNLGVIAEYSRHQPEAIDFYQRGISRCRQLGDILARHLANLASLRLELGQLDLAEQALNFAQRVGRHGIPDALAAELVLLSACVSFERGALAEAMARAQQSIKAAKLSPACRPTLGEGYRLTAQIALEEGDLATTARALEQADPLSESARAKAELSWLRARLTRALGRNAREGARDAARLADEADQEMLRFQCGLLSTEIARSEGDLCGAEQSLSEARVVKERMASRLPDDLRSEFLRRRVFQVFKRSERDLELALVRKGTCSARPELPGESDPALPAAQADLGGGFFGAHASVRRLFSSVRRLAAVSAPVLIYGETGTGKELLADAIHGLSPRAKGPMIKVNCAALVESLLLSELFGYERGAFTGATTRHRGRFELADGGTIFLDEIGEISPRTQVALLRVLQDGCFERVGGTEPVRVNSRVVCATHRDLAALVDSGQFRQDLYFRLNAVVLSVPPLRERGQDLHLLVRHGLRQIALERCEPLRSISRSGLALLERHRWPGNVRELFNVLRAASLLSDNVELTASDMAPHLRCSTPAPLVEEEESDDRSSAVSTRPEPSTEQGAVDYDLARLEQTAYEVLRGGRCNLGDLKRRIERECVERALDESEGNITRAAELLGMKRPRLSQLVKEFGLLDAATRK